MSFIAAAIIGGGALAAGGSIVSSIIGSNAANKAANTEQSMFDEASGLVQPFISAGASVLPTLKSLITPGPDQTSILNNIPGFTFAQDWGQKAVQNLGTTRGLGGNVLTAGSQYATGLAQQGWSGIVSALQNLVNTGGGAASSLLGGANTAAGNIGAARVGAGSALASGVAGAAGAGANTLSSLTNLGILNNLTGGNLFKGMYGGTGGGNNGVPLNIAPNYGGSATPGWNADLPG